MKTLIRIAAIAAALGLSSQPCLAAAAESHSKSRAASMAASGAAHVEFDLKRHMHSAGVASMSLAASQQTASEIQDPPKRKGPGTTTWIVVGGVVLLLAIVVLAAQNDDRGLVDSPN